MLSKQEDKKKKWKVDENRNSKCPIRPMHWITRKWQQEFVVSLIIPVSGDAIRRRP